MKKNSEHAKQKVHNIVNVLLWNKHPKRFAYVQLQVVYLSIICLVINNTQIFPDNTLTKK